MKNAASTPVFLDAVAEMQGLDGPFSFPEKLLQKIWLRRDFDLGRAILADGRAVRILHPGKWNLLGGPDFKGARLRLGETEMTGDVELHLRAEDWIAHAHAADSAYENVILHVVLFPSAEKFSRGGKGREIPVLTLLPLLHHDLEEFAADEAVERLTGRSISRTVEELGPLGSDALKALLQRHAEARWRQKIHFAQVRLQRLGWEAACHHTALEILGYRFNRAPMLSVAAAWPLAAWTAGKGSPEEIFAANRERWSVQGVRPANHPRLRLQQYATWARVRPDWPACLEKIAASMQVPPFATKMSTAEFRRMQAVAKRRKQLADEICAEAIGGTRLDNLICDGFWPLLAIHKAGEFFALWFHWPAGDLPPHMMQALRALGLFDGRSQPACHGFAQGLLGWMIANEHKQNYAPLSPEISTKSF